MAGARFDPFGSFHFFVEIDGIVVGMFQEVTGMDSESQVIEQREASKTGTTIIRKLPGSMKWSNVTLKRGMTDDMALWKWRKDIVDGKIESSRKNGSITLYTDANVEKARWNFVNAWPTKLKGPSLNAKGNEVAIEEVELTHEGMERVK